MFMKKLLIMLCAVLMFVIVGCSNEKKDASFTKDTVDILNKYDYFKENSDEYKGKIYSIDSSSDYCYIVFYDMGIDSHNIKFTDTEDSYIIDIGKIDENNKKGQIYVYKLMYSNTKEKNDKKLKITDGVKEYSIEAVLVN